MSVFVIKLFHNKCRIAISGILPFIKNFHKKQTAVKMAAVQNIQFNAGTLSLLVARSST